MDAIFSKGKVVGGFGMMEIVVVARNPTDS
jgi:hypothetical protein